MRAGTLAEWVPLSPAQLRVGLGEWVTGKAVRPKKPSSAWATPVSNSERVALVLLQRAEVGRGRRRIPASKTACSSPARSLKS